VIEAGAFITLWKQHGVQQLVMASDETTIDLTDAYQVAEFYGRVAEAQKETAKLSKRQKRKRAQMARAGPGQRRRAPSLRLDRLGQAAGVADPGPG
jgi:hypothetical protein